MAGPGTSKSHTHQQKQHTKAAILTGSRPSTPTLMGITFTQHWTSCHLGSTPYPMTISDSLRQDASLAPIPERANAPQSMTPGTDPSYHDGSGAQQKDGVQPPISQLQVWWEQEVVDEPYHGIGATSGSFPNIGNNHPAPSSSLASRIASCGTVCHGEEGTGR